MNHGYCTTVKCGGAATEIMLNFPKKKILLKTNQLHQNSEKTYPVCNCACLQVTEIKYLTPLFVLILPFLSAVRIVSPEWKLHAAM